MSNVSNLRFPKVFVFNPTTELIAGNTVVPNDLTTGQVGFFNAKTGVGATLTPTNITAPVIQIHQNLGDNKFGTTRTKNIPVQSVRAWYGVQDAPGVDQISYIGYDEVVGTKTLTAYVGQEVEIIITIYDNELTKWYGKAGYSQRLLLDIASCVVCLADCTLMDPDTIADNFIGQINGTTAPANNFPVTLELSNWITASKVATGTQGAADRRVGIKLVAKPKVITLIDKSDPKQFFQTQLTTFVAGVPYNCPNFPITTTVKAKAGNGYPLEVTDLEKESQGYDRVRDQYEYSQFMKPNFILRAVDGVKYDFYYLEAMIAHRDSGTPKEINDPYIIVFIVPAGTGGTLQTLVNGWLTPLGFDAVLIAAGTTKGSAVPQLNS